MSKDGWDTASLIWMINSHLNRTALYSPVDRPNLRNSILLKLLLQNVRHEECDPWVYMNWNFAQKSATWISVTHFLWRFVLNYNNLFPQWDFPVSHHHFWNSAVGPRWLQVELQGASRVPRAGFPMSIDGVLCCPSGCNAPRCEWFRRNIAALRRAPRRWESWAKTSVTRSAAPRPTA